MKKENLYATLSLLNGANCEIIIPKGLQISRALMKSGRQRDLDPTPFLMEEMCLINGQPQDLNYYLQLMCDDYMQIMEIINLSLQPIFKK